MGSGMRRMMMAGGGGGAAYATWNPLDIGSNILLSSSDLTAEKINTNSVWTGCRGTVGKSSGTASFENTIVSYDSLKQNRIGIIVTGGDLNTQAWPSVDFYIYYRGLNAVYGSGGAQIETGLSVTSPGDIVTVEYDADNNTVQWRKNGALLTAKHTVNSGEYFPYLAFRNVGAKFTTNFGQSAFSGAVSSGIDTGWV